ncbi:hypothetical protein [uncultured Treponema sp.]|uniref:hypothetical protein n=1 Tax=uncultured Treponema sp. TaxID=162155 RepID=UPI0015C0DE4E|nr:hypothetical protein [uncultured Treponema sp.]
MAFKDWVTKNFPNKGNNEHSTYSLKELESAYNVVPYANIEGAEEGQNSAEAQTADTQAVPAKKANAKTTSLIAQIIAALWVAVWSAKNFITEGGQTNDIIFSGFAIAACFSPVYFNMILDKVKTIRFGE